jgi:hypothetical protein
MVCKVESTVIVGAVLEVDENQLIVWCLIFRANEDISFLQIIVRKHHWTIHLGQVLSVI